MGHWMGLGVFRGDFAPPNGLDLVLHSNGFGGHGLA